MESLEWHERLLSRLIKNNPDATIKDYLKITEVFNSKEYVQHTIEWAEKMITEERNKPRSSEEN